MPKTVDPDAFAFGMVLRVLAHRIAKLERGDMYLVALDDIREFAVAEIGKVTVAGLEGAESIRVRAIAQTVAEHILATDAY